jgi:quercetin dioxygenase-like cupin family protein
MDMPIDIDEAKVETFDLRATAAELRAGSEYASNGRSAQTLAKGPDLNATLVVINEGVELGEHAAPASAVITVLEGEIAFISGDGERTVATGGSVAFAASERHSVRGIEESAFLLLIAARGRDH